MSVPLQCSLLPDVGESHHEDRHEYEHFAQAEERDLSGRAQIVHEIGAARQLSIVDPPGDHEDRFDVEYDEEDRDEEELDGKSLEGVAEGMYSGFVGALFYGGGSGALEERGQHDDQQTVDDRETEQHQDWQVRATHGVPDFVKNFTN